MKATYMKLRNGSWGIRVTDGTPHQGDEVTVEKKAGGTKLETIDTVLFKKDGVSICSIAPRGKIYDPDKFNGYGAKRGGYRKKCITDGNCSSFGSGRSCGGWDCDGWE